MRKKVNIHVLVSGDRPLSVEGYRIFFPVAAGNVTSLGICHSASRFSR
ncbi:hypothetical protein [Maribellus luteus]|nr:hypothetical protein [Maribellus luteus]